MTGNTFGRRFKVTTFGESHGRGLGAIIDGCPAGLTLSEADIQKALDRRRPGQSKYTSQRKEPDIVHIQSGVYQGKTTGTPIGLYIENTEQRSSDYRTLEKVYRPGHADFTYHKKYGHRDHRGGGRASARETVMRVAAGAIAEKYLYEHTGLNIVGYLSQLGPLQLQPEDIYIAETNPFFCPNQHQISALETLIDDVRKAGDSYGALLTIKVCQVPTGLGEPVFDKLDAMIAQAMMSIPAVKGVEIGDGFDCVTQKGSEHRDPITSNGFLTNHAGGILGGISSGQDIVVNIALKPTSSIPQSIQTMDQEGHEQTVVVKGRHDPCVGLRAVPIAKAMMALVLMDAYLLQQSGHY